MFAKTCENKRFLLKDLFCKSQVVAFFSLVFRQVTCHSWHLFNLVLKSDLFWESNHFSSLTFLSSCFTFSSVIRSCILLFLSWNIYKSDKVNIPSISDSPKSLYPPAPEERSPPSSQARGRWRGSCSCRAASSRSPSRGAGSGCTWSAATRSGWGAGKYWRHLYLTYWKQESSSGRHLWGRCACQGWGWSG